MRQITRPQSHEDFVALELARLWSALQIPIEDGWTVDVYVIPNALIRVELECRNVRGEDPIVFGRMVDAAAGSELLEILIHCGCGRHFNSGGGIRVISAGT